jgi:SWI/SNF-related matrix-associated actin-dependent regulator of chromatin subfamily A member 5
MLVVSKWPAQTDDWSVVAFVAEDSWFKTRRWTYCVLDEGHRIKNSETNLSHRVQGIGAMYRLSRSSHPWSIDCNLTKFSSVLTGTPVQNNLVELWGLLHWLYPNVFTSASERLFKDSFDLSRGVYSLPFLKAAQDLLATIMLRRTKATVEMSVPPREELTVFIPMTEAQRFWTYRLLTRMDTLELEEIFTAKVQNTPENQGRMEVMSHLAHQIKQSQSGHNSRTHFTGFVYSIWLTNIYRI